MSFLDTLKQFSPGYQAYNWLNPAAPQSPDYMGVAQQQTEANRPNQNTPYASTEWAATPFAEPPPAPTGNAQKDLAAAMAWQKRKAAHEANKSQNVNFSGPLAGANESLMNQAGANLSAPMDWGQFGQLGTGDDAMQQAIDASYGQATRRLDPMFKQREEQARTQLINQGLDPSSEAFRAAMTDLSNQRNDAYGSAMNNAIMMGRQAGDSVFRNNILSRQQAISEALGQRGQPLSEMQQLQGFLAMPGFNGANYLDAAGMQGAWDMNKWNSIRQGRADTVRGGVDLTKTMASGGF